MNLMTEAAAFKFHWPREEEEKKKLDGQKGSERIKLNTLR